MRQLLTISYYLLVFLLPLPSFAQRASKGSLRDSSLLVTNETDTVALAALAAATNTLYVAVTNDRLARAQGDAAERAYTVAATNTLEALRLAADAALRTYIAAATNSVAAAVTNDHIARAQGDAANLAYTVAATNALETLRLSADSALRVYVTAATNSAYAISRAYTDAGNLANLNARAILAGQLTEAVYLSYVRYTGAITNVNLGAWSLYARDVIASRDLIATDDLIIGGHAEIDGRIDLIGAGRYVSGLAPIAIDRLTNSTYAVSGATLHTAITNAAASAASQASSSDALRLITPDGTRWIDATGAVWTVTIEPRVTFSSDFYVIVDDVTNRPPDSSYAWPFSSSGWSGSMNEAGGGSYDYTVEYDASTFWLSNYAGYGATDLPKEISAYGVGAHGTATVALASVTNRTATLATIADLGTITIANTQPTNLIVRLIASNDTIYAEHVIQ